MDELEAKCLLFGIYIIQSHRRRKGDPQWYVVINIKELDILLDNERAIKYFNSPEAAFEGYMDYLRR